MPTTRLAAIMFTDIVGYTAMMQRDREAAMQAVRLFESHLNDRLAQHTGKLLQTYGDGSLSTFDSASAAVQCALDLQQAIREIVPLRIGIHLGEITIDGDHTFGDGVNIASRIESMGVGGSVLVSNSIRQQIRNKPEFELQDLGKFAFKNVSEPMSIYALGNEGLAVPKVEEMQGKGEKFKSRESKSRFGLVGIGMVAIILGTIFYWNVSTDSPDLSSLLSQDIREAKVAVSVFENFTKDENLDALGYMASEWISSGLRELKVRTVSPEMVRQNLEAIGILPNDPNNKTSFAEITGAEYVVTGSYFLNGDSIVLNTRMSSTITGDEVETNFPRLVEHKDNKEKLVEAVREYLLGYWVMRRDQNLPLIRPPKYEAYQEYLNCYTNSKDCLERVYQLDSTFLLVRVALSYLGVVFDEEALFQHHASYVEARWDQCTQFEKNYFLAAKALRKADYQTTYQLLDANYALDSNEYRMLNESAYMASSGLNRPDIAILRYDNMLNRLDIFEEVIHGASLYHYQDALNRTGQFEKAARFYEQLPQDLTLMASPIEYVYSLLAMGKIHDTELYLEEWRTTGTQNWQSKGPSQALYAAYIYAFLHPDQPNPFLEQVREDVLGIEEMGSGSYYTVMDLSHWNLYSKFPAFYLMEDWNSCEELLLELKEKEFPEDFPWINREYYLKIEGFLGTVYAQQGKREKALSQIEKIQNYIPESPAIAPWYKGTAPYLVACVYAVLGEKELAVEQIEESIRQGRLFIWGNFTLELDFTNLKGYPPFEELIRPKE